jgi:hypothetical protein
MLRAAGSDAAGAHDRRSPADHHMVSADLSDPHGHGANGRQPTVGETRGNGNVSEEQQHANWRGNARRASGTERCTAPREGNALKGATPRTLRV